MITYIDLCKKDQLETLQQRRKCASILLCFDILTNLVDCPELLSSMNFYCPLRFLRDNEFLRPNRHTTNYAKFNSLTVMQENFNVVKNVFEFDISRNVFKRLSRNVLSSLGLGLDKEAFTSNWQGQR